jgi:hypothetical protein
MALLGAGCTKCGQPYGPSGIRVLAQREDVAFVQLVCFTCQTQTLALVTGGLAAAGSSPEQSESVAGSSPARRRKGKIEVSRGAATPISEADVVAMRFFLDGYQGDLRGLLGTERDMEGSGGDADSETGRPG